ncbi:hypothetical protein SAMN03159444_00400 [Pseudomonas sp. NFACC02]|nr:hypothetical protein SAMN03159444_00400 [Pseudomonas sp. NFACC02]
MDARTKKARSVSSSPSCSRMRQSRHRKSRLGCRPNADDAQWAERHGCRESAVRAWMPVRRGPTERRRSAGTRRRRAQPGAGHFWYFWCLFKSDPPEGRKGESAPPEKMDLPTLPMPNPTNPRTHNAGLRYLRRYAAKSMSPALRIACTRLCTLSLRKIAETCAFTVVSAMARL